MEGLAIISLSRVALIFMYVGIVWVSLGKTK